MRELLNREHILPSSAIDELIDAPHLASCLFLGFCSILQIVLVTSDMEDLYFAVGDSTETIQSHVKITGCSDVFSNFITVAIGMRLRKCEVSIKTLFHLCVSGRMSPFMHIECFFAMKGAMTGSRSFW